MVAVTLYTLCGHIPPISGAIMVIAWRK